jgi:pre-rRNA-processing protein IPI1
LTSLESRLVPYFFINHATRGALVGPFRKLLNFSSSSTSTRPVGFLVLDVAATLLGLDRVLISGGVSKEAEALEQAVSLSLGGVDAASERSGMLSEMREYWDHTLLMMKRHNR